MKPTGHELLRRDTVFEGKVVRLYVDLVRLPKIGRAHV